MDSIINIIQEMLQKGESEEKIYATLKEMGVEEKQIKNLLLIAQANTFTLLKTEIAKLTNESIAKSLPKFADSLKKEILDYNEAKIKEMEEKLKKEFEERQNVFEQKQLKELQNITEIVENVKELQEKQNQDIVDLDIKIEEKTLGSTKHMKILRISAFILAAIMLILTIYKFAMLGLGYSLDYLIFYILNIVAAVVIMILSLI